MGVRVHIVLIALPQPGSVEPRIRVVFIDLLLNKAENCQKLCIVKIGEGHGREQRETTREKLKREKIENRKERRKCKEPKNIPSGIGNPPRSGSMHWQHLHVLLVLQIHNNVA
jgi:hypothetical protein